MRPCVRAATLDGFVELARSFGLDPVRLMGDVGLDVADLATPEKWIPAGDVATLLQLTADQSGHEDFGLLLAGRRRLSTLGPLSIVLSQEPDLRSALRLLDGYERSYNEALHLRLEEGGGLATIRLWLEFAEPVPVRPSLELAAAALHGIIKQLLGRRWEPLSVCFSHPEPETLDGYHDVFGARLQFDHPFTGLVFFADQLDAANTMSDPLLRPYAEQFLRSMPSPRGATVSDRVRELIDVFLPLGRCSTAQVARNLGVTQRTLHRQLTAEGHTFSSLVDDDRAELAERYLANERYTLTEVSELLGFLAPSAFSRWFRVRFGVTPSHWRDAARRPSLAAASPDGAGTRTTSRGATGGATPAGGPAG